MEGFRFLVGTFSGHRRFKAVCFFIRCYIDDVHTHEATSQPWGKNSTRTDVCTCIAAPKIPKISSYTVLNQMMCALPDNLNFVCTVTVRDGSRRKGDGRDIMCVLLFYLELPALEDRSRSTVKAGMARRPTGLDIIFTWGRRRRGSSSAGSRRRTRAGRGRTSRWRRRRRRAGCCPSRGRGGRRGCRRRGGSRSRRGSA